MYINSEIYDKDVKRVSNLELPWEKLEGKNILLTGASGLIGTHLVDIIMYKNQTTNLSVKIFAVGRNLEKAKKRFEDYWQSDNFKFLEMDINKKINIDFKIDYIIHAASNTHPKLYFSDPIGSIMTNVLGTYNLLEFAKNKNIQRFVFLSSVEIYGQALNANDIFDEKYCGYLDSNTFRAAYPEGKRAGEALLNAYKEKYDMDIVIPRLSRVYGPTMRLNDTKAMSQFILNGVRKENIVLKSKGEQRFSYCYVSDAAAGIFYVMLLGKKGEAYNIADSGEILTLREITKNIADFVGTSVIFDLPKEDEKLGFSLVSVGVMNTDKLQNLGFRTFDNVKTGSVKTIKILSSLL